MKSPADSAPKKLTRGGLKTPLTTLKEQTKMHFQTNKNGFKIGSNLSRGGCGTARGMSGKAYRENFRRVFGKLLVDVVIQCNHVRPIKRRKIGVPSCRGKRQGELGPSEGGRDGQGGGKKGGGGGLGK